ncbi:hypothetical protein [Methylosinus sporium]|uniref:Pepco domain-containing protein n=1 Tax=Methylosinus sporium TaxID=428 RepID=UPI00383AFF54
MTDLEFEIVVSDPEKNPGEKSLFDRTVRGAPPIIASASDVTKNINTFCQAFVGGIEGAVGALTKYQLDKIEINVELNAKGEVRLIASASTELKGGIKLIFIRKEDGASDGAKSAEEKRDASLKE